MQAKVQIMRMIVTPSSLFILGQSKLGQLFVHFPDGLDELFLEDFPDAVRAAPVVWPSLHEPKYKLEAHRKEDYMNWVSKLRYAHQRRLIEID